MKEKTIFTIGHSTHSPDYFLELLKTYRIDCVADVRQTAASNYNPQYNAGILKPYLQKHDILYLHMGHEFGARPRDPLLLGPDGKVDFDKVRQSKTYREGLERLANGVRKGYRIALMCSQADPFDCHRFVLIAYSLVRMEFRILHILKDKTGIDNSVLEQRLLEKYRKKLPQKDLFNPHIDDNFRLEEAYRLRSKSIAYKPFA